jgi:hypothetical protein
MNPESLSECTCDACGTRIGWGPIQTDPGHTYYHRHGACRCSGRRWYTQECGSHWTHHVYTDEREEQLYEPYDS